MTIRQWFQAEIQRIRHWLIERLAGDTCVVLNTRVRGAIIVMDQSYLISNCNIAVVEKQAVFIYEAQPGIVKNIRAYQATEWKEQPKPSTYLLPKSEPLWGAQ